MKRIIPIAFSALLLCGCPEAKLPKPTPMVPEPKATTSELIIPQIHAQYPGGAA